MNSWKGYLKAPKENIIRIKQRKKGIKALKSSWEKNGLFFCQENVRWVIKRTVIISSAEKTAKQGCM